MDMVLSNFMINREDDFIPQHQLNEYIGWLMASAHCVEEHVQDKFRAKDIHDNVRNLFERYAVSDQLIHKRKIIPLLDILLHNQGASNLPMIYEKLLEDPRGADISQRTAYFQEQVLAFMHQCYPKMSVAPNQIVHVTSMGCIIPTPIQRFLSEKNWAEVPLAHAYFYGCHAAIPALRMASGALLHNQHFAENKTRVDIVHTELLSIHMNALDASPGNIIAATLFSDGMAKYSLSLTDTLTSGLKIICIDEQLIPNTAELMRWEMGSHQFQLYLDKEIPAVIAKVLPLFVEKLYAKAKISHEDKLNMVYALHPGGSKILDTIATGLQLTEENMRLSRSLFSQCGNLSSATLPYLWDNILSDDTIAPQTKVLCLAFGPGMSIAGAILEKI